MVISVDISNTGDRRDKEVAPLYISDLLASITPPVRQFRGFDNIELQPGQTRTVTFTIQSKDLAFVDKNNKWVTEPGKFLIQIGGLEQK